MKKSILIIALFITVILSSCSYFEKELPVLGIIASKENTYINLGDLESHDKYSTFTVNLEIGNETEAIAQIQEKNPFAIVVCADGDMSKIIDEAKKYNMPLIIIGAQENKEALLSYDKVWCFSASLEQGGELLGGQIGNDFKDKIITDQNLDDILQCLEVAVGSSTAINSAIQSAADLGVYCSEDKLTAQTREQARDGFLELYRDKMPPEFVLCETEQLALGVDDALQQLNKEAPIAYIHNEITKMKLASQNLYSAAKFPASEMAEAAKAFINNILASETVNNETKYRLDKYKTTYFVYTLSNS